MLWVLVLGHLLVVHGYPTQEACTAAGNSQRNMAFMCIPVPAAAKVMIGASRP